MRLIKILISVSAVLLVIALILGLGVMMLKKSAKADTKEYFIDEEFIGVAINTSVSDINIIPSDDGATKVVCYETEKMTHTVGVKNGVLTVELVDERNFFDRIGTIFESIKITVYLPESEYGDLAVKSDTGRVKIAKSFTFKSIDISESTGEVKCFASSEEGVRIKTSTGKIVIEDITAGSLDLELSTGDVDILNVTCLGDTKISLSTGKTNITDLECRNLTSRGSTGSVYLAGVIASEKIDIERSTGSVIFDDSDAAEIAVATDTGDVKGTLLTEKIIFAESDTGRIDVPKFVTGGRCEITTDTGDIIISIAD